MLKNKNEMKHTDNPALHKETVHVKQFPIMIFSFEQEIKVGQYFHFLSFDQVK